MEGLPRTRLIPGPGGCAVLALLAALWVAPAWAERACGVARGILEIEAAAEAILAGENEAFAAAAVDELEQGLDRLVARLGPRVPPEAGGAATPIAVYILSRRELVRLYREEGPTAARERLRGAAVIEARRNLDPLLRSAGDCAVAGSGGGGTPASGLEEPGSSGESPPEAISLVPAGAPRLGAQPITAAAGPRLSMGGSGALPAADIRAGLMVLLALGLLLLTLVVLERGGAREDTRIICRIATRLTLRGASHPAMIVELGRRGAKLRIEGRFAVGERGRLAIGGATVAVRVAWVTASFAGVVFQKRLAIPNEELARLSR